ncbi:glycosyltransferase family 1 protein [Labilibacter sediminis]|nr:glycosyltransferase family 1 protein [Labilibacter sediminis]
MIPDSLKVLMVYYSHPLPDNRIKTLASFKKLTKEVKVIFTFNEGYQRNLKDKVLTKLRLTNDPCSINQRTKQTVLSFKPDMVFFVKGINIKASTIKWIKQQGVKTVFWSNDDMWGKHNRSYWFNQAAKHYDLVVSQKSYNCNPDELPSLGVKKLLFQNKAYDPGIHYPIVNPPEQLKHDVLFIGTYEAERYNSLLYLAENGITVHIYGWAKAMTDTHSNLVFHNTHLYGDDYASAFSAAKICLNFLRKLNRDRQTSRSIEIPACKGFMLAERTDEHSGLFEEGQEAEFFSDDKELLHKVNYYLQDDKERELIRKRGYERCISQGYTFDNRIHEIINTCYKVNKVETCNNH